MKELDIKAKYAGILIRPRITEKANDLANQNKHTFEISVSATKKSVSSAIRVFYGVVPVKVSIIKNPNKSVFIRGKKGTKSGIKKAIVYLKKNDKLE